MAFGKLNTLSIERAHRFGGPLLLSDRDGLLTCVGADTRRQLRCYAPT
jgi:hypothetical protein